MCTSFFHSSIDLSTPKVSSRHPAGSQCGTLTHPALTLSTEYTHSHSHTRRHTLSSQMLNILAQRLDRSPPVKERNKETDGIITSLDNLGKIVLTA